MRFLLDANVTSAVERYLVERGHDVSSVAKDMLPKTPDRVVVAHADQIGAIVVTWNRKHFTPLITRQLGNKDPEYSNAGLLTFECRPSDAIGLLERFIELLEFEHERRQRMPDKRVIVGISHNGMMLY